MRFVVLASDGSLGVRLPARCAWWSTGRGVFRCSSYAPLRKSFSCLLDSLSLLYPADLSSGMSLIGFGTGDILHLAALLFGSIFVAGRTAFDT